ncbi:hypothetical protein BDF14DRAFT_1862577 [Spinellus fusiger]|nr:hypothetical protein BDF14DRAFT_1862577 [Spinellus fusiger]
MDSRYEDLFDAIGEHGSVDGETIKEVWRRSQVPDRILASIWDKCDPKCQGVLDRQSFIQGMRAIDAFLFLHCEAKVWDM